MAGTMVRIGLTVLGEKVTAQAEAPGDRGRLDELLPLMLALDQSAIDVAVRKNPSGKTVSCAKGCSACCRAQPVPITPPEAYALWKLIGEMPEVRRREIRERFDDRVQQLESAQLKSMFLREEELADAKAARAAVEKYIQLKLVCPFLEDDACSIHPVRPFVCRQYLVTSSPALCEDPLHQPVEIVPMPVRPAHAMLQTTQKYLAMRPMSIPLVLALEFVEKHREELEKQVPMKEAMGDWLGSLVERAD